MMMGTKRDPRLPAGYIKYDWIESTDTRGYINLGVSFQSGYIIKTKVRLTRNSGNYQILVGSENDKAPKHRRHIGWNASLNGYIAISSYEVHDIGFVLENDYDLEASTISGNGYIKLDGVTKMTSSLAQDSTSAEGHVALFAVCVGHDRIFSYGSLARIHDTQFLDENGLLALDLLVCKDNTGKMCLYDTLSGETLYPNNQTYFTIGND